MAHPASALNGFEYAGCYSGSGPVYEYLPANPATAYQVGDLLTVKASSGLTSEDAEGYATLYVEAYLAANGLWVCADDRTSSANTSTMDLIKAIRVRPEEDILKATFAGHVDTTVASATDANTFALTAAGAAGDDDDMNGAYFYIYSGTAKGEWGIISDFTFSGLGVESLYTLGITPAAGDGIIVLYGNATYDSPVGINTGIPASTERLLEIDYDDGTTAEIFRVIPQDFKESLSGKFLKVVALAP